MCHRHETLGIGKDTVMTRQKNARDMNHESIVVCISLSLAIVVDVLLVIGIAFTESYYSCRSRTTGSNIDSVHALVLSLRTYLLGSDS